MNAVAPAEPPVVAVAIVFDSPSTTEFNPVDCCLFLAKQEMKGIQ
jgi:hypothetical protein